MDGLKLVGPGSRALFEDYVRIRACSEGLNSSINIIGHIFREIEASLFDVLQPVSLKHMEDGGEEQKKAKIKACLLGLDFDLSDPIFRQWEAFAGSKESAFQKLAHRQGLYPTKLKSLSEDSIWDGFEEVLDKVLRAYESKFLTVLKEIDQLLQISNPTKDDAARLVGKIPQHPIALQYFLERVDSPGWLERLDNKRFFSSPPAKRLVASGDYHEIPRWPASAFLVRMARVAPESVAKVIVSIDAVDNRNICIDLVCASLLLPDEDLITVNKPLGSWISKCDHIAIHDDYPELIARYLDIGAIYEALNIIDQLLSVKVRNSSDPSDYRFEEWSLEFFLEKVVPGLGKAGEIRALDLFTRLLNDTFTVGGEGDQQCWRLFRISALPAIEDHEQNQQYISHQCRLVFAVRDIALALATSHWDKVIACLHRYDDRIFARIEVYLRSRFPGLDPDGTSELLSREAILSNSEFHHERFHLLKACFDLLSKGAKANYLRFIDDEARWAKIRENRSDIEDEEWPRFKRRLIYDRLIPIAEYLEGDWKSRYEAYRAEFGEEPHPDFLFYMEGGRLINHMPSRRLDEYTDCDAGTIADQIRQLEAASDAPIETKSELANTLRDLVAARTTEFATGAHHFSDLPIMYTRSFLGSIRDYLETRRPLEPAAWHSVLQLCISEVRQYADKVEARGEYRETYMHLRTLISILQSGFKQEEVQLPIEERDWAWNALHPLTEHSDPQASEENPDADMATSSINTVRGESMHAVVDYAWWVRRNSGNDFKGMATVPEVREVLEKRLTEDKSLTIFTVYGRWYPWLETIDQKWAKVWKARIFPESDEKLRRVAWETYVTFCPPYNGIFESLKGDYAWAVTRIGKWSPDRRWSMGHPDESLLEHLFAYFWRGKLAIEDSEISLRDAYVNALAEHKVEALRYVGHSVKEWPPLEDPQILERLKRLWCDVVKPDANKKALETFGLWFSCEKFDAPWALVELQHMLEEVKPPRPEHWVIERLGQLSKDFPGETLGCLRSLYEYAESPLCLENWWASVMMVLRVGLSSEDRELKAQAIKLANIIGSKGLQPEHLDELRALVADT